MSDPTNAGSAGAYDRCDKAPQIPGTAPGKGHMLFCPGWLKCFKESVSKLQCGTTNCWDVIDILQFHAYFYRPQVLISKVTIWINAWTEDLQGLKGRKKKTLWLSEFARAGATRSDDPDGLTSDFMETVIPWLKKNPYVSGWSWFSQDNRSFASFPINGFAPQTSFWASDLIDAHGQLTVIGQKYVDLCRRSWQSCCKWGSRKCAGARLL